MTEEQKDHPDAQPPAAGADTTETKKASTVGLILSIILSPTLWALDSSAMSNFWVSRMPFRKRKDGDTSSGE